MFERSVWAALIPHQRGMALIDRVLAYDAQTLQAQSTNHRDAAHPLRWKDRLSAIHLCEYGAQAMAVHGALVARDQGGTARPGWLVLLRAVDLHVDRIDELTQPLSIAVERLHSDESAWLYRFRIHSDERLLADGQAMVKLQG